MDRIIKFKKIIILLKKIVLNLCENIFCDK